MSSYQYPPAGAPLGAPPQGGPPQYPPQQPPYWPQQTQTWPGAGQPQQAPQAAPPPNGGPPQGGYVVPDEAANRAHAEATAQTTGGDPFAQYVKWPGPQGTPDWRGAWQGFSSQVELRIAPPWSAERKIVFVEKRTHFYRSHAKPKGASIECTGRETCLICKAADIAMNAPDEATRKRAGDWGRVRTQYLYNVLNIGNPQAHIYKDGQARPLILGIGPQVQNELWGGKVPTGMQDQPNGLFKIRGGIGVFCNPENGRNLIMIRKKTGPEEVNIEYQVIDKDPSNLFANPQAAGWWRQVLSQLWNLDEQVRAPSQDDVMKALSEMGLPIPGAMGHVPQYPGAQPTAAWQPQPQAPYPNPYPQQQPQYGAPPPAWQPAPPAGPPPGYGAPPPGYGAPPPAQPGWGGPPGPPPGYPPQGAPPAGYGPPPPMQAPPVSAQPAPGATGYPPAGLPPPPPAPGAQPPAGPPQGFTAQPQQVWPPQGYPPQGQPGGPPPAGSAPPF